MRLARLSILSVVLLVVLQALISASPASAGVPGAAATTAAPASTAGTRTKSVTKTTVNIPGLIHPVQVALDASGVAHISALDVHDVFVAQGYYEAENRLFQMEFQSMLASGTLSNWVGAAAKGSDTAQVLTQVPSNALLTDAFYKTKYPKYYSYLQDFSLGVNDYIQQGYVPLGFRLLKQTPFRWQPLDSLYWQSYFGKGTENLPTELQSSVSYATLGYAAINSLKPYYPPFTQSITGVPGNGTVNGYSLTDRGVSPSYLWSQNWYGSWATGVGRKQLQAVLPLVKEAISNVGDPWPGYNLSAPGTGSNAWVVAGSHSTTGHPLLANDPHLQLLSPSIWLPVDLSAPGLDVSGWSLVDLPGVLLGHTRTTAWGGTNAGGPTAEPYLEQLNGNDYYFDGTWHPMQVTTVDSVPIYSTNNGPLIARQGQWGISLYSDNRSPNMAFVDEIRLDQANSYATMLQSFSTWNTGPRNWVFATSHHIGFIAATRYPLISEKLPDGKQLPVVLATGLLSGSGGYEVSGYVPFKYLPQVEDPRQGYLYVPNQPTVGEDYPYPIIGGGMWSSGGRAETIAHYLANHPRMSPSNMKQLQSSITDYWASELTPYILSALRGTPMNATEAAAFSDLAHWKYSAGLDSRGMTIYYYFLDELYAMSFDAVLTAHGLPPASGSKPGYGSSTVLYLAQHDPHSMWFNGSWTSAARQAFAASTSYLSGTTLGTAVSGWEWYKVHQVLFQDPLHLPSLAIGPIGLWGDNHTVSAGYTSHQLVVPEPPVAVGPSLRFVASPHTRQYWGVFPGGASEHVGSPWYANQLSKWLKHQYYVMERQPTVAITTYRS